MLRPNKICIGKMREMTATYMVVCSYICFLLDFLVSALLSDCKGAGIRAAAVAVNNKKLHLCHLHIFLHEQHDLNETTVLL